MKHFTLAAFGVERRIAVIALFRGSQLEDTRLRHLPLDASKASGSVLELVTEVLERHKPEFVAISRPSAKSGDRIRLFCESVKDIAGNLGIPAVEVDELTLRSAYLVFFAKNIFTNLDGLVPLMLIELALGLFWLVWMAIVSGLRRLLKGSDTKRKR